MEAGDLHDPGRLYREEGEDDELIAPERALAEMRGAVERLRRQLQAGLAADRAASPDVEVGDRQER